MRNLGNKAEPTFTHLANCMHCHLLPIQRQHHSRKLVQGAPTQDRLQWGQINVADRDQAVQRMLLVDHGQRHRIIKVRKPPVTTEAEHSDRRKLSSDNVGH
jgi:hypothetical protein